MMDRIVSLGVGTQGAEDFFTTFQELSELARNLGVNHNYVSVSSSITDEDLHDEPAGEDLYYDENTLCKVMKALRENGMSNEQVTSTINDMQNAGIFFRERLPK